MLSLYIHIAYNVNLLRAKTLFNLEGMKYIICVLSLPLQREAYIQLNIPNKG